MPHTYIIIFGVILVAALLTCFIPLGKYDTKEITYTVNGSEKTRTVVDPDSFQYILDENGNKVTQAAPIFGTEDFGGRGGIVNYVFEGMTAGSRSGGAVAIIAFILVVGGAFGIVLRTGAVESGIMRVPLTLNVLYVIPILITLVTVVFGITCFLLHYGVFVEDLGNVLRIALRLVFYLTGVFWNIAERLPAPYNSYIGKGNPIAFLITSMRQCVLYGQAPHRKLLLIWFLIGLVLCILGIRKIYKSENSYVKVI